jgi:Tol biopolymer transport system component
LREPCTSCEVERYDRRMLRRLLATASILLALGLCASPASGTPPTLAANGRIAFADRVQPVIWTIRPDGTDQQLLAAFPSSPDSIALLRGVSFSADGSKLAVLYEQHGTNTLCEQAFSTCWSIVMLPGDGSSQRIIYSSEQIAVGALALSPDGRSVAFTMSVNQSNAPLFTIDSDGRHLRQVTIPPAGHGDASPTWSPDGKEIAFQSDRECCVDHSWSLYIVNVHNRHLRKVMPVGGNDLEPDWSPDGEKLAFTRTFAYPDYAIYSVSVDGTQEQQVARDFAASEIPHWSPSGDKILYLGQDGLIVVDANGGNRQVVYSGQSLAFDWRPNY